MNKFGDQRQVKWTRFKNIKQELCELFGKINWDFLGATNDSRHNKSVEDARCAITVEIYLKKCLSESTSRWFLRTDNLNLTNATTQNICKFFFSFLSKSLRLILMMTSSMMLTASLSAITAKKKEKTKQIIDSTFYL